MTRKIVTLYLILFILAGGLSRPGLAASKPQPLFVGASSAILVDFATGRVLWAKNEREKRPIASITKVVTAIIALENVRLDSKVPISQRATDAGESELYLSPGEERTVEELLYGALLRSANDASVALAEYVGGSVENFIDLMNKKAKSIGMLDTNFTNPHGLKDGNLYSTAYDLALIARYAMRNRKFAKIVGTKTYTIPWPNNPYPRVANNHNKLLEQYPAATGIKTGWTREAGYCLMASAKKNGFSLISVVLNAPDSQSRFDDSQRILDYGFANFRREKVIDKGKVYGRLSFPDIEETSPLVARKNLVTLIERTSANSLEKVVVLDKGILPPVLKGQVVGKVRVSQFGKELGDVELVAQRTILQPNFLTKILKFFARIKGKSKEKK